jgi:solute carrier family 25 oxoglutarate transporter 11
MDYGMRLASLHYFWGGLWSPLVYSDFNSIKYLLFSGISAYAVCWTGIPFEVARKAYYADQSWPAELRKGYRSPLHALCKIPFSEGPHFLFKGGLPIYLGNANFTTWTFWTYTWLKNKLFFLWLYNDINYSWVKFWMMNISFFAGSLFGYPFYFLKQMMEEWPKERGGRCTFQGSYWNAIKWMRQNWDWANTNLMQGYWKFFRRQGIIFYLAMWQADNMGLFTNNLSDINSIENIVGFSESD